MLIYVYYIVSILIALAYLFLILHYLKFWKKTKAFQIDTGFISKTKISVIIPIRNEAKNIEALLNSILANNYDDSLLEVIVVDDHSTDQSAEIVNSFQEENIKILSLASFLLPNNFNSFKKFGISKAVDQSSGELIITTDGDCIVPINWLNHFAFAYEKKGATFIAAPVNFYKGNNQLQYFQSLDFMGMMLITGANIMRKKAIMCNGANLGYSKESFFKLGAYQNIDEQASGDDVMLLNKFANSSMDKILFLKNNEVTIHTPSEVTWSNFKQQRIRWATKNGKSSDFNLIFELAIVFLACLNFFILLLFILISPLKGILVFGICFIIKMIADYLLLNKASSFFEKKNEMSSFLPSMLIHIFYISYIGILSIFKKKFVWKERIVE